MSVWGRTSANSTPVAVEGGAAGLRQVGGKGLVRCTRLREQRRDAVVVPARCLPQAALQVIEPPPSAVGIRVTAHPRLGRTLMRRDLRRGPPCRLCQLRPARSVSKCRTDTGALPRWRGTTLAASPQQPAAHAAGEDRPGQRGDVRQREPRHNSGRTDWLGLSRRKRPPMPGTGGAGGQPALLAWPTRQRA